MVSVLVLTNGHLPRVSRQSRLSANEKGDEILSGSVHRSPVIYLEAEENLN